MPRKVSAFGHMAYVMKHAAEHILRIDGLRQSNEDTIASRRKSYVVRRPAKDRFTVNVNSILEGCWTYWC